MKRRNFLKLCGAGAAAVAIPKLPEPDFATGGVIEPHEPRLTEDPPPLVIRSFTAFREPQSASTSMVSVTIDPDVTWMRHDRRTLEAVVL